MAGTHSAQLFSPIQLSPSPQDHVAASIAGMEFLVLAERALFWPQESMLIIADLHLGKSDIFRRRGVAVPLEVQRQDLLRLHQILQKWQPQELVILGDFVHGRFIGEDTFQLWQNLRRANLKTRFMLTRGNHDRYLQTEDLLLDDVQTHLPRHQVLLSHEPLGAGVRHFSLNIHGHVHPAMRVPQMRKRLPCLAYSAPYLNLPAFSEFTGSGPMAVQPLHAWVFADDGQAPVAVY